MPCWEKATIKHCWRGRRLGLAEGCVSCTACVLCVFFSLILTASLPNTDGASCKGLYKFSSDPVMDTQWNWVDKAENRRPCVLRDRGGLKKTKKMHLSEPHRDRSPSVPACQRVTNFLAGAGHQRAERLGVKQLPGSGRGRVYCLGDNGWDLTWHAAHSTLFQEARIWSITLGVIVEQPRVSAERRVLHYPGELGQKWLSIHLWRGAGRDSCPEPERWKKCLVHTWL